MKCAAFKELIGNLKPEWVNWFWLSLVTGLLMHPFISTASGEVRGATWLQEESGGHIILAQSDFILSDPPGTIFNPRTPGGGVARQAAPPKPAQPAQQVQPSRQARPSLAPSPRDSVRSQSSAPALNAPAFSVTPPAAKEETRTEGNTRITDQVSPNGFRLPSRIEIFRGSPPPQDTTPKIEIPQRGQVPSLTTKDAGPKMVTPPRVSPPINKGPGISPRIEVPQRGRVPSLSTRDAAPKETLPSVTSKDASPKVGVPQRGRVPSLTTKDVAPKVVTPSPESTSKSSDGLTTKSASENVELKTPRQDFSDSQQPSVSVEQQPSDSQKPAISLEQQTLDANKAIEEGQQKAFEEQERARREAEEKARLEDAKNRRIESHDRLNSLIQRENVESIFGSDINRDANNNAALANTRRQSQNLGNMIKQNQELADAMPDGAEDVMMAAKDPCLLDLEPYCEAVVDELEKEKEEQDKAWKEELEKRRKKLEKAREQAKREAERRKKNPQRGRNAEQKRDLDEREKQLDQDRDEIEDEKKRLEDQRNKFDEDDKRLREKERNIRKGLPDPGPPPTPAGKPDPNCRSAACQDTQAKRTKIQKGRIQNLKEQTTLDKKNDKFEREYRQWKNESDDLEKRLDRGEGLTKREHKARMARKAAEQAKWEAWEAKGELDSLEQKRNSAKKGLNSFGSWTEADEKRYRELKNANIDEQVQNFKDKADALEKDLIDNQGFGFEDFANLTEGDLKQIDRGLEQALQNNAEAIANVGKGGDQPHKRGAASLRDEAVRGARENAYSRYEHAANEYKEFEDKLKNIDDQIKDLEKQDKEGRYPEGETGFSIRRKIGKLKEEKKAMFPDFQSYARNQNIPLGEKVNRAVREYERTAERNRAKEFFSGLEAGSERDFNAVTDYNRSYGETIDEKGNVDPAGVKREARQFESTFGNIKGKEDQLGNYQTARNNLMPGPDGKPSKAQKNGISQKDIQNNLREVDQKIAETNAARQKNINALSRQGFQGKVNDKGEFELEVVDSPFARAYVRGIKKVNTQEKEKSKDRVQVAQAGDLSGKKGPPKLNNQGTTGHRPGTPIKGISKDRANAGQPGDSSTGGNRTSLEKTPPPSLAQKRLERGLAAIEDQVKIVEKQIAFANDAQMPGLSAAFAGQMDALLASRNQIAKAIETYKVAKDTNPAQLERGLAAIDNQVKIVDKQIAVARDSGVPGLATGFASQRDALLASRGQIAKALENQKAARDAGQMQVARLEPKITPTPKDAPKGAGSGKNAAVNQRALADKLSDVKKVNPSASGKTAGPGLGQMPPSNKPKPVLKVTPQDAPKDAEGADPNILLNRDQLGKQLADVRKTDPSDARKPIEAPADKKKSVRKPVVQDNPRDKKGENNSDGKFANVKKTDPAGSKTPVLFPSGQDKPKAAPNPVQTQEPRDSGADKTAAVEKKSRDQKGGPTDSVKFQEPPPAPVAKQEEKKGIKVDPFLFDEIQDTSKYQDQVENKLANIEKLLAKAPQGSMEREELENQKKRYTREQIKNRKTLDELGDQVASLPPLKRKQLEQLAIKRRTAPKGNETGKGKPVPPQTETPPSPKDVEEQEILDSYIQYVGGTLIPIFKNSPLSEKFLPNLLSNLVVQFGPRVAEQIVDEALDSLEDRGLEPDAVLFVDAILKGIAAEHRMTKEPKDGLVADLARAQFLASLLKNSKLKESLKPGDATLEEVQFSLNDLVQRLQKELGKKLAREVRDINGTLDTLSNLLLLQTLPQSNPPSIGPLLNQFRIQLERAAQQSPRDLQDRVRSLQGIIGSLQQASGVLPAREKGITKLELQRQLSELLADSYQALSDTSKQQEKAALKKYESAEDKTDQAELLKKVIQFRNNSNRAKLGEAKSRLQAGQFSRALQIVENLDVQDAGLQLAQANVLIAIADEIEAKYGFLSADDRKAIGGIDDLRDKRDRALQRLVDNIKDPNLVAITSTKLSRNLEGKGKIREALLILDRAQDKKPDDLSLAGERARLRILQKGDKITRDAVDQILDELPQALRLPAAIVALTRLTQDENSPKALDALVQSLEDADYVSDAQRPKVDVEIAIAKIALVADSPQTDEKDQKLRESVNNALKKLDALDATDVDKNYLKARRNVLNKILGQLDRAEKWKNAITSGRPPPEGFDGIARQAMSAGRLDIASDALKKHVEQTLSLELGLEPIRIIQELRDGIRILDTLRMRMMDPRLTDTQRQTFQQFLKDVAPQIVRDIDGYIAERTQSAIATAGRVKDKDKRKERLANYRAELRLLGRLRLQTALAGVPQDQRQKKLDELSGQAQAAVDAKLQEIKADFAGAGINLTQDKNYVAGLRKRLAALNVLRALADGIQDYAIDNAPTFSPPDARGFGVNYGFLLPTSQRDFAIRAVQKKLTGIGIGGSTKDIWLLRGYEGQKEYLMGLQEKFLKEKSREGTLRRNTLRNQDDPAFKDFWLEFELLKDELEYYGHRRRELVKEDPRRTPGERNELFEKLLKHDAKTLRDIAAPSNALMELVQDITGSGRDFRQRATELEQLILLNQKQALLEEFEAGRKAKDPQRVFRAMVQIRDAALAGEIDRFVSYLHVDWYKAGPARAYNLLIGMEATQEKLEGVIADSQRLHIALIRAGYNLPDALSDTDQEILRKHGYLVGNSYAIPDHIKLTPTRVASEFADLTQKGNLAAVDSILNASRLGELIATVAIPGGIAGQFGKAVTLELLAAGAVDAATTRLLAYGAGLVVEAGVFTALSRGAQTALNPEMLLNLDLWTSDALVKEYAHNLAVLGALKIFGSLGKAGTDKLVEKGLVSQLGRDLAILPAGLLFGEAAVLTGLNSLLESNQITQDSYLENLVLIVALKGTGKAVEGAAKDSPLTKFNQARIRDRLVQAGKMSKPRPETRVSQLRDSQAKYYEWLDYEVYRGAIETLMVRFNGSWDAARAAYQKGKLSEYEMQRLFDLRKKIVDSLTREIQDELGGEVQAFGSENLTSDYDVSFVGPKAEIAVILFNARIANRWGLARDIGGGPSGFSLDTNVYTNPRHFEIKGGEKDVMFQDGFAHLAARKYLKDAAWKEYRDWLLENVDPQKKAELESLLNQVEKDNAAFREAIDAKIKELEASNRDLTPEQVKIAAENALYESALKDINALVQKYNKASGAAKDKLAQDIRNLQSKALYFAQEAYHTEAAIKHVVMSIQAEGRKITPESLLADGPPVTDVPITAAEGRQSYIEQVSNMLKEINKDGDPAKLSSKAAKYFIRAFDAAKFAGIDLTSFKNLVEITYELDANRKDIQKVKEILKKKYGAENLDQFLKDVRKANMELTAQLFGGPRDFSVATGVGKTGDSVVIALPEALKPFAAEAPVEMARALEGAKDTTGMETKDRFVDPDAETKDNLPRVETDGPGDIAAEIPGGKPSDPNAETKFETVKPQAPRDKGPSDREAREMVKNYEERVARENAALLRSLGIDIIYADPRYRHLLEGQRTEREDRSLAITGNLRDMMTPGEKALADKAYDIAESLRASNPDFANLNKFEILRYVHFHSGRTAPGEAPRGPGGQSVDVRNIPASLAAEAILAQGRDVKITPEQLADATGLTVKEARMAIENATAWRDRGGKVEPPEDGMADSSPRDSPPPPGSPPSKPPGPPGKGPGDFTASGGREPDIPNQARSILDRLVKDNENLKGIDEAKAIDYIQSNLRNGVSPAQLAVEAVRDQGERVTPKEVQSAANISDRLVAQAAVRKAYVHVQKAQRRAALQQENQDIEAELERRAKAKPARDAAERRAAIRKRHEIQGRRAKAPRFDLARHQEKFGDESVPMQEGAFVPRHHLVEGDTDTLVRIMEGSNYSPIQNYVEASRVNRIVQDLLDGNFDWERVKDKKDFIEIGPQNQIGNGHHRLVAAQIVSRLTGRPVFGIPEANPIIPDGMVVDPWTGPNPTKTTEAPAPKGRGWRIRVDKGS